MKSKIAIVVLAVIGLAAFASARLADEPANANPFAGKFITVYSGPDVESGFVLTDVALEEIGGRKFLVGTGADTQQAGEWTVGLRVAVPWEEVTTYVAMTKEQFDKFVKDGNTL